MNRAGLFIHRAPDASFLAMLRRDYDALVQSAGPVRVLFLYGEAARAADLTQVPEADRQGFAGLLSECRDRGGSTLVCQTAIEKLGVRVSPYLALSVGSLGQWFDLLHELDVIRSLDP